MTPKLILASGSQTRRRMLEDAGFRIGAEAPGIDEDAVKRARMADGASGRDVAVALADRKALAVSARHGDAFVIGGDQVLCCEGRLFDKPADTTAARHTLAALRGRNHELITAVAVARDGRILWRHVETAILAMRTLSDDEIDRYLAAAGDVVLTSVGAYQLEGLGAQLFERVEGDFFTILGLPLLPLLAFLRRHDIVPG